ncbi:MAG: hypothetical protein ABTQ34_05665 [Bdellovibrionales bacterium]
MLDDGDNFGYMHDLATRLLIWADGDKSQPFPEATILRIGPSSIALIPDADPDCVVKVVTLKRNPIPEGLQVEREFGILQKLYPAKDDLYVTPKPLAWGTDPSFIVMERLGPKFDMTKLNETDVENIGRSLGAFSADIWEKYGSIHSDICIGNYTKEPNGKIGIIDIASVIKEQHPENMLCVPLLQKPNISPYLADEFEKRSGVRIRIELATSMMQTRLAGFLAHHPPETAERIQNDVASNLEEWRALTESGRLSSHRPSPRARQRNAPVRLSLKT